MLEVLRRNSCAAAHAASGTVSGPRPPSGSAGTLPGVNGKLDIGAGLRVYNKPDGQTARRPDGSGCVHERRAAWAGRRIRTG